MREPLGMAARRCQRLFFAAEVYPSDPATRTEAQMAGPEPHSTIQLEGDRLVASA